MSGADLRDRSLVKSNLAGRDIRNADLRGTDLSGANLQRADLRGVQFNTPQPAWLRTLNWMLGQAKTAGGIAVGILLLLGSVALVFWIMRLVFNNFWIALTGGILTAIMALSVLWPLAGRLNLKTGDESRKRSTCLRKADLRGAQMDAKLRDFARRQGATID